MTRASSLFVMVILTACGPAAPGGSSTVERSDAASTEVPATSSATASPSVDPMANPTVDGRFAINPDGLELALACWGEGTPTVLLQGGGPGTSEWRNTQLARDLATLTRVCTYDRAGQGASDDPPFEKRDADDAIADLRALLEAAEIEGPYVLVGRSFGGMIVTHFADELPEDVLGVVVIDTPAPSAEFTEESEPDLVWDSEDNAERLDVIHGFENRFANEPPQITVPLLLITPTQSESNSEDQSFWLQVSEDAEQVTPDCGSEPTQGACSELVTNFVSELRAGD